MYRLPFPFVTLVAAFKADGVEWAIVRGALPDARVKMSDPELCNGGLDVSLVRWFPQSVPFLLFGIAQLPAFLKQKVGDQPDFNGANTGAVANGAGRRLESVGTISSRFHGEGWSVI